MSTIQFGGVISGLNTQGIIDALVAAEKQPLTTLQAKEADLTAQKTAYQAVGSALDDLIAKVQSFTVTNAGAARTASSSDSSIFTAAAGNSAAIGSYQIHVDRIATVTRAQSSGTLGSALTGVADTTKLLNADGLATAITKGNMTLTVDGNAVPIAVDPATSTLQSVMDSIQSALQTQLQATDPGATVTASLVNGHLQLAIAGEAGAHDISFGGTGDTSNLARALGLDTQGVTGSQNASITGTASLDPTLASLNFPGSVTGGQISAIVDGTIVRYTVGDPSKTTLPQFLAGFAGAIQTQLQAGGANAPADATATVTASIVDNRLQIAVGGAGATHSIWFGSAGDTSNALGIMGMANQSATNALNPTLSGDTNLGVVRLNGALDNAGLTGLTSTKTGVLTLNGVAIKYDTTVDSLSTLVNRINNAGAGVIASIDRSGDKLLLTRKDTGAVAIDIQDTTGTLGAALKLAPGTTNSQTIGQSAQLTLDGRTITSASNTVTGAIDGVAINLLKQSPTTGTTTMTIGVDQNAIASSLTSFVNSFNALGDLLDKDTAMTPGQAGGTAGSTSPLSNDPTMKLMFLELRDVLFQQNGSGLVNSMGALGLNTGAIGSTVGTTNRIQLNTTKLASALQTDATQVAGLLANTSGPMGQLLTALKGFEDPTNSDSYVQSEMSGLGSEIGSIQSQEINQQEMVDNYQAMIEAQFASMESTLATLQAQSSQVASLLGYSTTSSGSGLSSSSTSGSGS